MTADVRPRTPEDCRRRVSGPCLAAAVALLTASRTNTDVSREELLDGHDLAEVAEALEAVPGALLDAAVPGEQGARLLQRLGLLAVTCPA